MRRYYKQQITQEEREMIQDLLDVYSMQTFFLLDLCFFTFFLGCLLFPLISSIWVFTIILVSFFTVFFLLLQFLHTSKKLNNK